MNDSVWRRGELQAPHRKGRQDVGRILSVMMLRESKTTG